MKLSCRSERSEASLCADKDPAREAKLLIIARFLNEHSMKSAK